jgi:ribosomal protein L40E
MEPTIGTGEIRAILIVFVVLLGFAAIPATYAKRKGYNFWLVYLFGFFFLVPTLIVVAILPSNDQKSTNIARTGQRLGWGGPQTCTICGSVNDANVSACAVCGMAFAASPTTATIPDDMSLSEEVRTQVNERNTKVCRNCGRLNSPGRTTCKTCKAQLVF